MKSSLAVPEKDVRVIDLPAWGGHEEAAHVIDEASVFALNAALATGRPLLVRGDPGMGKSQLARAAAVDLERVLLTHPVDARTEPRDLLWTVDAVARLAEAQVMGALPRATRGRVQSAIDVRRFTHPGVLWWAFHWESARKQADLARVRPPKTPDAWEPSHGTVVLIDEIDKADASVPNALLDALGHGRFETPDCDDAVHMDRARQPLVVITTNEERSLPDAFLRRCFVLHLGLSEKGDELREQLYARGRAHFNDCDESILRGAAELIAARREELRRERLVAPGVAEYIDLVRAVTRQSSSLSPAALMEKIKPFVLYKHAPEPRK